MPGEKIKMIVNMNNKFIKNFIVIIFMFIIIGFMISCDEEENINESNENNNNIELSVIQLNNKNLENYYNVNVSFNKNPSGDLHYSIRFIIKNSYYLIDKIKIQGKLELDIVPSKTEYFNIESKTKTGFSVSGTIYRKISNNFTYRVIYTSVIGNIKLKY